MGEKVKKTAALDTALRLSSYFGNSAKFWLGLQDDYHIDDLNRLRISKS